MESNTAIQNYGIIKILDVGGNRNTHPQATHIIDIKTKPKNCKLEYTKLNICEQMWPFKDNEFDYIYCSNILEDIKDPLFVCLEMMRVGKRGKIIVPSILTECRIGIDMWPRSEKYAGFCHHRWLCFISDNCIEFIQKLPITHIYDWTSHISDEEKNKKFYVVFEWEDKFKAIEHVLCNYNGIYDKLKEYFGLDPINEEKGKLK